MREYGILFPKVENSNGGLEVLEKSYSFDDSVTVSHNVPDGNNFLNKKINKKRKMVSHKQALHLDALTQEVILKYF